VKAETNVPVQWSFCRARQFRSHPCRVSSADQSCRSSVCAAPPLASRPGCLTCPRYRELQVYIRVAAGGKAQVCCMTAPPGYQALLEELLRTSSRTVNCFVAHCTHTAAVGHFDCPGHAAQADPVRVWRRQHDSTHQL
jgi:hypothetical protein